MDPATVAQAIAQIIAKINELNERSAAQEWQSEVTSKLDLVIAQNGQIIALLRDLFMLIPAELERFFNQPNGAVRPGGLQSNPRRSPRKTGIHRSNDRAHD
ncbi:MULTISPECIES: hypothetical protein [Bradyrhizobium]|uniref:hypothetical protein n=1 Tax=Bradyrhizobium TaxID=374 RepID=UPI00155F137D|nr:MULTISPECIES: hypothetical protein [Bradyrhizobium]UUO26388.1 hypothetical protein DCG74_03355 [Bradyrhizobium sp. WBAH42]